jgi:competence protein ComEC
VPGRLAGAALLLPALWPALRVLPPGEASVDVLDVGHGLATLVRTGGHALLFDTGPRYGPESDAGQRVVVPVLRALGVGALDALVLSHEDIDHSGGVESVLSEVPVAWWTTSLADSHPLRADGPPHEPCVAGRAWEWDGVAFEILHPPASAYAERRKSNHMSCVLRVRARDASFLLTGDIEKGEEAWLLGALRAQLPAEVLQVPHQGSRSSSTAGFVEAVAPQHAIIPVGYRNRYKHPHPEVEARYRDAGVRVWRTDNDGAVHVHLGSPLTVAGQRSLAPRYWQGR